MTDAEDWMGGSRKTQRNTPNHLFYICFPRKGTLTDAGGWIRGGLFKKQKKMVFLQRKNNFKNIIVLTIFYTMLFISIIYNIYNLHKNHILHI